MNLLEAARTLTEFKQLAMLVSESEAGQAARWDAIQDWMRAHPTYETMINNCLTRSPEKALTYLCKQLGLDLSLLQTIDVNGQIQAMATKAIAELQTLYKERKDSDEKIRYGGPPRGLSAAPPARSRR